MGTELFPDLDPSLADLIAQVRCTDVYIDPNVGCSSLFPFNTQPAVPPAALMDSCSADSDGFSVNELVAPRREVTDVAEEVSGSGTRIGGEKAVVSGWKRSLPYVMHQASTMGHRRN